MSGISDLGRWVRRETIHGLHALNPVSRRKAAQWENSAGVDFLRAIGVKEGDVVIDFGCGPGKFCIPAVRLVGVGGMVFAVDKNRRVIRHVRRKAGRLGMQSLRTACSLTALPPLPEGRSCNVALLYDILHFLDKSERQELYKTLYGMLTAGGLLSVHMKHVKDNNPGRHFAEMSAEEVAREIEAAGFYLSRRLPVRIWHSYDTENSLVWNFVRR